MPKCFISYGWDSEVHKTWVKDFATSLRKDGIETILDQWHLCPGDQIPHFMEKSITDNDFILIICTPNYKVKSDNRIGGVGYEGDIITAELFTTREQRKFIPILREGTWANALPVWLNGKLGIDLSGTPYILDAYNDLVSTLKNMRDSAPSIGEYKNQVISTKNETKLIKEDSVNEEKIKISGILVDEVTIPKNDGTRGSALYAIPFKLNRTPSNLWTRIFVEKWNHPPRWSSMHRPGIARVSYNKIILDGTTIDEVKKYHRDTLLLVVEETNRLEMEYINKIEIDQQRKQKEIEDHKKIVSSMADDILFD